MDAARVTVLPGPRRLRAAARTTLDVAVDNQGSRAWDSRPSSGPPVLVSCHWRDERGAPVITDGPRTPFERPLAPGASAVVPLDVYVPVRPGRYTLEVDLVEEGVSWFEATASVEIDVVGTVAVRAGFLWARAWSRRPQARWRRRQTRVIPRVLHRIWLGEATMPEDHRRYGERFQELHPRWESHLWGDDALRRLVPRRARERARSSSELSDLLRYEVLRRYGGVYVDTDVEPIRAFDPLLDAGFEAFCAHETPHRTGSAVLGSVPGHPVFELAALESRLTVGTTVNSVESVGPGLLTMIASQRPFIHVFPTDFFYAYRWDERRIPQERLGGAYAVHHWAKSWVTPDQP